MSPHVAELLLLPRELQVKDKRYVPLQTGFQRSDIPGQLTGPEFLPGKQPGMRWILTFSSLRFAEGRKRGGCGDAAQSRPFRPPDSWFCHRKNCWQQITFC